MELQDEDAEGQAEFWQLALAFVDSLALKCAVELGIARIIQEKGGLAPSSDTSRLMRFLVKKRVFSVESKQGEAYYGLTRLSNWLVRPGESGLAPMSLLLGHPTILAPWHYVSKCMSEGGKPFEKAHHRDFFDHNSDNLGFVHSFNDAMASGARVVLEALLSEHKSVFSGLTSLVDVGGGTGTALNELVNANPHISGINFDLPDVVSTAPNYPGVLHVGGDMFSSIPTADAVFVKSILHDWSDTDCVKILKQCRKALPKGRGKAIIVDVVLRPEEDTSAFAASRMAFDMVMFTLTSGGMERTEEWRVLFKEGGFSRCKIFPLPTLQSIIEAYPDPDEPVVLP
ncbi:hypothetical protein AMTRI_Chr07g80840 [Amborella trichopoda]